MKMIEMMDYPNPMEEYPHPTRQDLVVLGAQPFDAETWYLRQTLQCLAERHRIIWIDFQETLRGLMLGMLLKVRTPVNRLWHFSPCLQKMAHAPDWDGPDMYMLRLPPLLPINPLESITALTEWLTEAGSPMVAVLRTAFEELNIEHPMIFSSLPPFIAEPLVGELEEQLHIYCPNAADRHQELEDTIDEHMALFDPDAETEERYTERAQRHYLSQVDGVLTGTYQALELADEQGVPAHYLPPGVTVELFQTAAQLRPKTRSRPVVGYFGPMDTHLDVAWLTEVVQKRPDLEFWLVGRNPGMALLQALPALPHVRLYGPRPMHQWASLMAEMHAGLLPIRRDKGPAESVFMTLLGFLASGLPVVRTSGGLTPFWNSNYPAHDDPAEAAAQLKIVVDIHEAVDRDERIRLARSQSWNRRAESLMHWMFDLVARRQAR